MHNNGLLVDLDGVLVDFVRGTLALHHADLEYKDVRWDFDKTLFPSNVGKFWEPLGFDFWANLDWTPFGKDLLSGLVEIAGANNICFCTSPCQTIGSVEGKIEWLRRNIPSMSRQFMVTPVKYFAAKGNILVDDRDENCSDFIKHGGTSLLVPALWNNNAALCDTQGIFLVQNYLKLVEKAWRS